MELTWLFGAAEAGAQANGGLDLSAILLPLLTLLMGGIFAALLFLTSGGKPRQKETIEWVSELRQRQEDLEKQIDILKLEVAEARQMRDAAQKERELLQRQLDQLRETGVSGPLGERLLASFERLERSMNIQTEAIKLLGSLGLATHDFRNSMEREDDNRPQHHEHHHHADGEEE